MTQLQGTQLRAGLACRPGGKFLALMNCGRPGEATSDRQMIGLDLAYQFFLFEPRTVTGNPNPAINGRYKSTNQALSLTFRLNY